MITWLRRRAQEPIPGQANQTSFYFEVNGLPIFAKGSNAIPLEVVPSRGRSPAALRRLVRDAADSYQNMLRVWGGATLNRKHASLSGSVSLLSKPAPATALC